MSNQPTEKPRFPKIVLKPDSLKRVKRGHRWVFSNEIGEIESTVEHGGMVAVTDKSGTFYGSAVYSKNALIAARIFANHAVAFDAGWIVAMLQKAHALRERLMPGRMAYRLAYGDSDGLPGVIVDRYGDVYVIQLLTAGADLQRDNVVAALKQLFNPRAIVERSDSSGREFEGLPAVSGLVYGELEGSVTLTLQGVTIEADVLGGQKTGLYLDQLQNWMLGRTFASGARVLDLFCHAGGWSLFAGAGGAASVTSVDQSEAALAALKRAWGANHLDEQKLTTKAFDVFQFLRSDGHTYDLIICDPPAFAKNRKSVPGALRGYQDVNRLAMKRLAPGGILVSCSCSHNVDREEFLQCLRLAARDANRNFKILENRSQSPDHPVLLGVPETEYLKVVVLQDS